MLTPKTNFFVHSLLVEFDDTVDDRNIPTFDLKDEDLSRLNGFVFVVGEKKKISSKKSWFHASTKGGERQQHSC